MTKEIVLTRGKVALVDAGEYETLVAHKWFCHSDGYAVRTLRVAGSSKTLRMHRVLMAAPDGLEVDHINGDGLDNRKCNLRLANKVQNQCNRGPKKNNTSGFKGVSFNRREGKYVANISVRGKQMHLGYYPTPEAAHEAYCAAALKHHGEFARTV